MTTWLDLLAALPGRAANAAQMLLTQPAEFVTTIADSIDTIPATVVFIGHAANCFLALSSEAGEKGGKRASWLKTLILGYLLAQAGVDISNWLVGLPLDTWTDWKFPTIIAVVWYASTCSPLLKLLGDFKLMGIPVFAMFMAGMTEVYSAQGIRDVVFKGAGIYGAKAWASLVCLGALNTIGGVFLRHYGDKAVQDTELDRPSVDFYFYLCHTVAFAGLTVWTATLPAQAAYGVIVISMLARSVLAEIDYGLDWTPYASSLVHAITQVPDVSGLPHFVPSFVSDLLSVPKRLARQLAPKPAAPKAAEGKQGKKD